MSSDWRSTTIGEQATLQRGFDITKAAQRQGSVPVVSSAGIGSRHDTAMVNGPGVVLGRKGVVGSVHFIDEDYWPHDTTLWVKDFHGNDEKFVYYFFLAHARDLSALDVGSANPTLNRNHVHPMEVLWPALDEQHGIANLLGALDDRIALLRETNATLEAIAQALFKSWFVDFDPVRAKQQGLAPAGMDEATAALFPDSFEESAFGLLPRGWRVQPVGQVVEGIYDGPHATPPEADEGPVFLGIKNLTGSGLDFAEVRHIAEADFAQWTRRVEPQPGDIVFSYEATLGFFALIPPGLRCCLGRRLALIRPRGGVADGHFLFHQFVAARFQRLLERHTIQGATVNRIALKQFPTYPVLNPPDELKACFGSVVTPLWARIHENHAQAQTLASLRDTLLPRLISGQLRLPQAEAMAEHEA